ncbi:MAG: hypothetical protein ACLPUT_02305 [Solirubrobacteraceae bacterium]
MSEPSLPEKIVAVHERLERAGIAHAFGGALALAYYAEPRATDDIDINVFVAPDACAAVGDALAALGVEDDLDRLAVERDGQCRLWWGRTPLDVFFAYDDFHQAMRRDARMVPFGEDRLPILAPEHLLVCKIAFDRPKDWLDLEQVVVCVEDLDVDEVRAWLVRIVGAQDPRMRRFDQALDALHAG